MKAVKLVIFDLDGTLIDAYAAIAASFNYVMCWYGLKPQSPRIIRGLVGWGDVNLLKPYIQKKDLKRALDLYRNHHQRSLIQHTHLYPQARRLLGYLKDKGCSLAVASNRPSRFSHILLKHLGIENFFNYVLCADQGRYAKPHPEMLNKIVKRLKVDKSQTLYVGDMAIDAQAGRRARIDTIIVTSGSSKRAEIEKEKPLRVVLGIGCLFGLFKTNIRR